MFKLGLQKVVTALLVALLLSTSLATLVSAAAPTAAVAQQLRTKTIAGSIKGGEFAKLWLGLEPEQSGAQVTVVAEWDRENASSNGVGFFVLDEEGLKRVGDEPLSGISVAGGSSSFFLNGASNVQGASFNAIGLAKYTLVIYNDSGAAGNFKVTATNAFITDDSKQVTDPNAPAATVTTTTTTTSTQAAPSPAPVTQAVTTTTTSTTTAPAAAAPATTAPAAATTAPAATAAPKPSGPVSATTMEGELPTLDAQHFLGLTPSQRDGEITLRLTFDPQDSSELARRLNFWVLDSAGFTQFQNGSSLSEVAIAAGNRTFRGDSNERVANFKSVNLGPYTVIVENKSRVPATYQLRVDGGLLLDDSGQTKTAQATGVSTTSAVTSTTTSTTPATAPAATTAPAASAAPAAGTAGPGKPGGTYTVQSGDSLSTIARDIYGDLQLYRRLCEFNGIANCDVIEVGDVINLPTAEQIQSGASAPAAATARPTPTPAPAAARPATTTAVTTTRSVTPTVAITSTKAVTTTTIATTTAPAVENTSTLTTTTPATTTATTNSPANTATAISNANLVDVLTADGRFTSLVKALQATGLDKVLKGRGPFTVFAPTDAAFATLPKGAFEQLLADPGGQLKDILLYHVVSSKTMSTDISNNLQATTVQGKPVKFTVKDGGVRINSADITDPDLEAINGVVHAINNVILPPPK